MTSGQPVKGESVNLARNEISVLICYHRKRLDQIEALMRECEDSPNFSMSEREDTMEHLCHAMLTELRKLASLKEKMHNSIGE